MYSAIRASRFESSVVLDGTKTMRFKISCTSWFESSVVLDGTKTLIRFSI